MRPPNENVWNAFLRVAAQHEAKPALVVGTQVTRFGELRQQASVYARELRARGVAPRDRVVVVVDNTAEAAAGLLAVWSIGAIPALLHPALGELQRDHAITLVRPTLIAHSSTSRFDAGGRAAMTLGASELSGDEAGPCDVLPTDAASIVFTSGSTGRSKGVVQSHGNVLRGCAAVAGYLGIRGSDLLLCPIPWSFDYGYGQLLSTVTLGVTQIVTEAPHPGALCEAIVRHRPTVLAGLPSVYSLLLSGLSPLESIDYSSLRLLMNTGGRIPRRVLRKMIELFGTQRVALNYGLTETYRTCFVPRDRVSDTPDLIGVPIPGVDVMIAREDGTEAAAGEIGEIVHRGDYVCLGYFDDPEATARAVRPDPKAAAGTQHRGAAVYTGDYGLKDGDGMIYFRGRRDHQIKSMGMRVSPEEVENILLASDLVSEVAVVGVSSELAGEEVAAVVVLGPAGKDREHALRQYAKSKLSRHMVPRRWAFVESLPRTSTGKIDYVAIRHNMRKGSGKPVEQSVVEP